MCDTDLSREIRTAIERVVSSGWYVLGPEVEAFEEEYARAIGTRYGVGVASGTDAISLSLMALDIGAGDEVVTSPLTATFTALAISRVGARPVFADVDPETLTLSPASVEERITARTRAIVPVHLYGNACAMDALLELAETQGLVVVEDACQAHGARYRDRPLGAFGRAGAFSFYPTKNLGALGDGGFITTDDEELAATLARLRNGGQKSRYVHTEVGLNSRLDEIQAAVLRAKLPHLERWNRRRRELAGRYEEGLDETELRATGVLVRDGVLSARHLFVVRTPSRDAWMERLASRGVQTLVHYPVPVHLQPAYRELGQGEGSCPVAEEAATSILSLPLYPSMSDDDVDYVVESMRS
ncbi:MAG: DegT/DnrJ/EryC1/StrS family aminotransferase [Acidobacteria bacterium]|nr:MAG: DegT/DnrJ/EryC1/StrS family aminotransferase [Acidobacteriota bacterium]